VTVKWDDNKKVTGGISHVFLDVDRIQSVVVIVSLVVHCNEMSKKPYGYTCWRNSMDWWSIIVSRVCIDTMNHCHFFSADGSFTNHAEQSVILGIEVIYLLLSWFTATWNK
jgi:hypothetical protein